MKSALNPNKSAKRFLLLTSHFSLHTSHFLPRSLSMKRRNLIICLIISLLLTVTAAFGQAAPDTLDGSALRAGDPFRFTVTVHSDTEAPFTGARGWLTAILCPAGGDRDACQVMTTVVEGQNSTDMPVSFSVERLPQAGDYTMEISYTDETGTFASNAGSYLITGVRAADDSAEPTQAASGTPESTAIPEQPEPAEGTETLEPTAISETPVPADGTELPESTEDPEPTESLTEIPAEVLPETPTGLPPEAPAGTPEAEVPPAEPVIQPVTLRPEILDGSGTVQIYGSTVYVRETYSLRLTADTPLNDGAVVIGTIPASMAMDKLDNSSECNMYLSPDRTALRIPGGSFSAESGNAFSCSFSFTEPVYMAAQPFVFSVENSPIDPTIGGTIFEMAPLSWTNYPVNIAKFPATHQLLVTDSKGTIVCSDTVPCGVFHAEDVYTLTYKFPADWGAAVGSGKQLSADLTWPENWAQGLQNTEAFDLLVGASNPCSVDWEGKTTLILEETGEGRYSASCSFVPDAVANPSWQNADIHLNDDRYQINDLRMVLPSTIQKAQAVLTPSLKLQISPNGGEYEQIGGSTIPSLYRTPYDYPNSYGVFDAPAKYTLRAEVSGVSPSRVPQFGDHVLVRWTILDRLAQSGDLPACLMNMGNGYQLGILEQTADGKWAAECSFYFPQTMDTAAPAGVMDLQLVSGVYQTSTRVDMYAKPFNDGTIYVDLEIPQHLMLNQPTEFHARVTDDSGGFSEYLHAVLDNTGVSLRSEWDFNYQTTCQGEYLLSPDGTSDCAVFFDQPNGVESTMHFNLDTPAVERLFNVVYRPAQDFTMQPVTNVQSDLTVRLFHAGTEIPLPASDDTSFIVSDAYQLKFYLKPTAEYADVLNAVSVDGEGLVLDWWEPLRIFWGAIPGGQTALSFYRDGDQFVATYDFSFPEGGLSLDGPMSELVIEASITGWDINLPGGMAPIQLPKQIEKMPLTIQYADIHMPGSDIALADIPVGETAEVDLVFNGSLESLDLTALDAGFMDSGIRTPITCDPDLSAGVLHCSFVPSCGDLGSGEYPLVCGSGLVLYAEYAGDAINEAATAPERSFNVRRSEVSFEPVPESSLRPENLIAIEAVADDLQNMGYGTVSAGGWNVDSFLPREIRSIGGITSQTYPVVFRYTVSGNGILDEQQLSLDVVYLSGSSSDQTENTIFLAPRMVTNSEIFFELDFGSYDMTANGQTVHDALDNAAAIRSMTLRYAGSDGVGAASRPFESEGLNFDLKVATVLDLDAVLLSPGQIHFDGVVSAELMMQPFTVYCSQFFEPLQCSLEAPLEVLNEAGEPILSEIVSDGCWGTVQIGNGVTDVYINNGTFPQCYLTAWNEGRQIWIAADVN